MAYIIGSECIRCGSCEEECPADAIVHSSEEYVVEITKCLSCGTCATVCPVNAPKQIRETLSKR
ncbi:ferredoxin [Lachnospiraceae bacterium PF1-21]